MEHNRHLVRGPGIDFDTGSQANRTWICGPIAPQFRPNGSLLKLPVTAQSLTPALHQDAGVLALGRRRQHSGQGSTLALARLAISRLNGALQREAKSATEQET